MKTNSYLLTGIGGVGPGIGLGILGTWLALRYPAQACAFFAGSVADWVGAIGTVGAFFWAIWLASSDVRRRSREAKQEGLLLMALVLPELFAMRPVLVEIEARLTRMDLEHRTVKILQPDLKEIAALMDRLHTPRLPTDIHGLAAFNWHMGSALAVLLSNLERLMHHAKWMREMQAPRTDKDLVEDLQDALQLVRESRSVASTSVGYMTGYIADARGTQRTFSSADPPAGTTS